MLYSLSLNNPSVQFQNQFISLVKKQANLVHLSKQSAVYTYYDTFDWRLYRRGLFLYVMEKELILCNFLENKTIISQVIVQSEKKEIIEIDGKIEKNISLIIGVRALLRVATFQKNQQVFRILNPDEKTIGRMRVTQNKIKSEQDFLLLQPWIEFQPLRGYNKEIRAILKKLPDENIASAKENILEQGLKVLKKVPGSYTSKFRIALTPQLSTDKALKKIYLHLLQMIKNNEYGIIKDYDTEFLHDFRVAVRRTRSGLSQLKDVLDQKTTLKVKKDFAFLGQATNNLRDSDVYLLNESSYRKMIPPHMQKNLDPFFLAIRQSRAKEHSKMVRLLRSKKYVLALNNWEQILTEEESNENDGGPGNKPIIEVARKVIRKRNQRIVKFGREIMQNSSDELLHKLRIEAKKLRYLLEFFNSLFPQQRIQKLILNLKQTTG